MSDTLLKLNPGTLPEGYCWPSDPQQFNVAIMALARAVFPGTLATFNYGNSLPTPENRDKPWVRTDANGYFDDTYTWKGGVWGAVFRPIRAFEKNSKRWVIPTKSFFHPWPYPSITRS